MSVFQFFLMQNLKFYTKLLGTLDYYFNKVINLITDHKINIDRLKFKQKTTTYLKLRAKRPSKYLIAELTKVAGNAIANHLASIRKNPLTSFRTILLTI